MNLLKSTVCFTFFLLRRCIRAVVVVAVVNVVCFFGIETVVPCAWCVLRLNCGKANDCGKLNNLLIPWNRELLLLLFISSIFRLMLSFFSLLRLHWIIEIQNSCISISTSAHIMQCKVRTHLITDTYNTKSFFLQCQLLPTFASNFYRPINVQLNAFFSLSLHFLLPLTFLRFSHLQFYRY